VPVVEAGHAPLALLRRLQEVLERRLAARVRVLLVGRDDHAALLADHDQNAGVREELGYAVGDRPAVVPAGERLPGEPAPADHRHPALRVGVGKEGLEVAAYCFGAELERVRTHDPAYRRKVLVDPVVPGCPVEEEPPAQPLWCRSCGSRCGSAAPPCRARTVARASSSNAGMYCWMRHHQRPRLSFARARNRADRRADRRACGQRRAACPRATAANPLRRRAGSAAPVPATLPGSGRTRPRGARRLRARRRVADRAAARAPAPLPAADRRALRTLPERPLRLRAAARWGGVVPGRLAVPCARRPRAQRRSTLHLRGRPPAPDEEADPRPAGEGRRLRAPVPAALPSPTTTSSRSTGRAARSTTATRAAASTWAAAHRRAARCDASSS
jgi:hypothetical protein